MSALDTKIDELSERLASLEAKRIALHFAVCGERMYHYYEEFHANESRGDPSVLRSALDVIWSSLENGSDRSWSSIIADIDRVIPHGHDFDSLAATEAQDACIVIEASIQSLNHEAPTDCLEYVFEPLRSRICLQETGYLQLGSGEEFDRFEERLIKHPLVQQELAFQHLLLERVSAWLTDDATSLSGFKELGNGGQPLKEEFGE